MDKVIELIGAMEDEPFHWTPDGETAVAKSFPDAGVALALSPHPSDAERSAILMERLKQRGWRIHNAICTAGVSGVLDRYLNGRGSAPDPDAAKAEIRRRETVASALAFGLTEGDVEFLYDEHGNVGRGDPKQDAKAIADLLARVRPDVVVLPSGNDENKTHVGVFTAFRSAARTNPTAKALVALYHEDPKTISMDPDLLVWFTREESMEKARLVRFHDSQQQRRLERMGDGLDDRILRRNFERATDARRRYGGAPNLPFAEAYEFEVFGT